MTSSPAGSINAPYKTLKVRDNVYSLKDNNNHLTCDVWDTATQCTKKLLKEVEERMKEQKAKALSQFKEWRG